MIKDIIIPFITVFMGEMGDKTQLVTLTFATRYNWKVVMAGVFCGTMLLDFLSVCLGNILNRYIEPSYISLIAGVAFLIFALWSIREDSEEEENIRDAKSPFIAVFLTFFLAEMGDKTQLTTLAVSTQYNWLCVWTGAVLGMVLADGIAVFVGMKLGKMINKKLMKILACILFALFGIFYLAQGVKAFLPIGV
ncbi:MAG: TMEM165/GDT1 family protein [Armatimonadetes bacterium]|nr:TMEM165/GDT1 family protein [Candidatus Hippobium faecium]